MKKNLLVTLIFGLILLALFPNASSAEVTINKGDGIILEMSYQNLVLSIPGFDPIGGRAMLILSCDGCKEMEVNTPSGKHQHTYKFAKASGMIIFPDIIIAPNVPLFIGIDITKGMMIEHSEDGHSGLTVDVMSTGKTVALSIFGNTIELKNTLIKIKDSDLQFIKYK